MGICLDSIPQKKKMKEERQKKKDYFLVLNISPAIILVTNSLKIDMTFVQWCPKE